VFLNFEQTGSVLISHQTIVVAPPVPSLSDVGLVILGMSLAVIALFSNRQEL